MSETKTLTTLDQVRRAGWDALVAKLGPANATRFILQYERGYGDYVDLKDKILGTATVDELYERISSAEGPS